MSSAAQILPSCEEIILQIDGKSVVLPLIKGSEGELALDISKLRSTTGVVTFDIGYVNTGACLSGITFLDGEQGILRYRGYPIEQLAQKAPFIEICHLLIHGNLPKSNEFNHFVDKVISYSHIPEPVEKIIRCFPKNAHPMSILSSAISALAGIYPQFTKPDLTKDEVYEVSAQLLAHTKNIIAFTYRHLYGHPIIPSKAKNRSYCSDFLNMMFADAHKEMESVAIESLNKLLILHADHEQNCSTSTVRMVGSSKASLYSSISAGISALWGPLHGGANQAVIEMLNTIHESGKDYKYFLEKAKDKKDPFKLMGFGHRVYKNFDPRAKIIKKSCDSVLSQLSVNDPLLDIAKKLEEAALNDPYFVDRKLYPNVDFYSGIIYKALGIPSNMFTPMFVLGRLPGWIAQWKEMNESDGQKIGRPRQIYTGELERSYIEIKKR